MILKGNEFCLTRLSKEACIRELKDLVYMGLCPNASNSRSNEDEKIKRMFPLLLIPECSQRVNNTCPTKAGVVLVLKTDSKSSQGSYLRNLVA